MLSLTIDGEFNMYRGNIENVNIKLLLAILLDPP